MKNLTKSTQEVIPVLNRFIRFLGDDDITFRRIMEEVLANEEEHADELRDLLATLDPTKPAAD